MNDDAKEYLEGKAAYFAGYRQSVRPYPTLSRAGIEWTWGYLAGEQLELNGCAPKSSPQGSPGKPDNGEGR